MQPLASPAYSCKVMFVLVPDNLFNTIGLSLCLSVSRSIFLSLSQITIQLNQAYVSIGLLLNEKKPVDIYLYLNKKHLI